jgi:hypothetical protein
MRERSDRTAILRGQPFPCDATVVHQLLHANRTLHVEGRATSDWEPLTSFATPWILESTRAGTTTRLCGRLLHPMVQLKKRRQWAALSIMSSGIGVRRAGKPEGECGCRQGDGGAGDGLAHVQLDSREVEEPCRASTGRPELAQKTPSEPRSCSVSTCEPRRAIGPSTCRAFTTSHNARLSRASCPRPASLCGLAIE